MNRIVTALVGLQITMICAIITLVLGMLDAINGQGLRSLPEIVTGFVGTWVSILAMRGHILVYLASLAKKVKV